MSGARYGADLIVFRKVLQTLQGVIADVCDQAGVDAALAVAFLGRLVAEWPARLMTPPFSRALGDAHVQRRARPPPRLVAADRVKDPFGAGSSPVTRSSPSSRFR